MTLPLRPKDNNKATPLDAKNFEPKDPFGPKAESLRGRLEGETGSGQPDLASDLKAAADSQVTIRTAIFRQKREKSWEKLDQLTTRLDKKGLSSLSNQEAMELPLLYQTTIASLALARRLVLDQNLLAYLENLAFRGHLAVYGPRRSFGEVIGDFFARDFPQAIRALKIPLIIASMAMFLGFLAGFAEVLVDSSAYYDIVPASLSGGRGPESTASGLRAILFAPWPGFERSFVIFAGSLFRHNSSVAFLAFGLGFALGLPTVALLFANGKGLGAMLAIHWQKGLAVDFMGWILIHGVTELLAIIIAGAAGIGVAERIFLPGERSRRENLAKEGPTAAAAMVGAVFMFLLAGFLEGGFRQLFASTFLRYTVAVLSLLAWGYYFTRFGRKEGG